MMSEVVAACIPLNCTYLVTVLSSLMLYGNPTNNAHILSITCSPAPSIRQATNLMFSLLRTESVNKKVFFLREGASQSPSFCKKQRGSGSGAAVEEMQTGKEEVIRDLPILSPQNPQKPTLTNK